MIINYGFIVLRAVRIPKMRRFLLLIIAIGLFHQFAAAQATLKRTPKFPIWSFQDTNVTIHGISYGNFSGSNLYLGDYRNTVTNGLRLELYGLGVWFPIGNGSPITGIDTITNGISRSDYIFNEIINGINLSTGSVGGLNYNGITISLTGQYGFLANGLAISGVMNAMDKVNGISIGGLANEALQHQGIQIGGGVSSAIIMYGIQVAANNQAKTMYGIQIGLFNKTDKSKGLQIGLWNKNEHRSLPFINWSF